MKSLLTEVTPESKPHEHRWQIVEGGSTNTDQLMMVCTVAGCSETKLVNKPKLKESTHAKPVICG